MNTRDTLALALFRRQAESYEADPAMVEESWQIDSIRTFWRNEADFILATLKGTPADVARKALHDSALVGCDYGTRFRILERALSEIAGPIT